MLRFDFAGAPYEQGHAHGERFQALIREHVAATCVLEAGHESEIAGAVARIRENIARAAPNQLDELRGIADGAGLPLESILKLSFWPDVTSLTVGLRFCSLIGLSGLGDSRPALAKNSDHPLNTVRFLVLQRSAVEGLRAYARGTFVGTLGTRAGLNDAGLALTTASIAPDTTNWDGVPLMVVAQAILERCASVGEAIALAETMPTMNYSAHLMVADASGDLADIERMPDRMGVRRPENGVLFNTNHPLAPNTREHSGADAALHENSHARYRRLQTLLATRPDSLEALKSIMRDHTEPGAICQHGGPANLHTTSAYILLPARGVMFVAPGCPCQHEFAAVEVRARTQGK